MPRSETKDEGILPWKKFPARLSSSSTIHSAKVIGTWPDNLLKLKSIIPRFLKLPTSDGIAPVNELSDKSRTLESVGILRIFFGIAPVNLFDPRSRDIKYWQFPRFAGIIPLSLLSPR